MNPVIYEDMERGKCQRDIVDLVKKFEKDVEKLIEKHVMRFHERKPTEEERHNMLFMADFILKQEEKTNECDH